jgi:hypothetical protein
MAASAELIDAVTEGVEARRLSESKILTDAFESLRAAYTKALLSVPATDDLGRFRFVEALRQVDTVRLHLLAVVNTGELAQRHIAEMNPPVSLVERLKRKF